jgi:hypothetical protein
MGSSPAVGSDPKSEPVSMTRWRTHMGIFEVKDQV